MSFNINEQPGCGCGEGNDVRCGCGSLLARVVDGAVELKCRRCKRVWRLAVDGAEARGGALPGTESRGRAAGGSRA